MEMAYSTSCQQDWQMALTTKWDFADSDWHHFRSASSVCLSVPQLQNASKCPSVLLHETDPRPLHESPKWSPNCITQILTCLNQGCSTKVPVQQFGAWSDNRIFPCFSLYFRANAILAHSIFFPEWVHLGLAQREWELNTLPISFNINDPKGSIQSLIALKYRPLEILWYPESGNGSIGPRKITTSRIPEK